MNHDELLAKVNYGVRASTEYAACEGTADYTPYTNALRAVVELHKPTPEPVFVSELECKICDSSYPCPTIQAIQEQLK